MTRNNGNIILTQEEISIDADHLLAAAETDKDVAADIVIRCEGVPENAHQAAEEMIHDML